MRKLLSLLTAVLLVGSVWGADVQVGQFASDDMNISTNYKSYSNNDWTLSVGGGGTNASCGYNNTDSNKKKIGNAYGTDANANHYGYTIVGKTQIENAYKMTFIYTGGSTYANGKLYLGYSTDGETWNAVSLKTGSGLSGQGAGVGSTNTTYTFEFTAAIASAYYAIIVSKNTTSNSGQFRYDHVTATFFELEEDAVATPSIASSNEKSYFQGNVTITLGCTTEGASIYYTLDGSAPSSSSTPYSSAFTLDATTTVKAIAIKESDESEIASQTFTLCPTEMTCAEAKAAALTVSGNNVPYADGLPFTVQGFVTSTPNFDSSNEYVTYYIADTRDGGNVLQVFRAVCADESHVPAEGDIVDVTGQLTKYGSTPEFAAGATYTVTKLPYVTPELPSWNFGDDIEQGTIGSDDTQHLLKTISLTGANLTADVRLDVVTTGGGDIFFLNGYKSYITLSPAEGEINYDICAIASTSTAGSFAGTITISSLKATPEFEPEVINLSITVLAPIDVTGVELDESAIELEVGETQTLVATISPNNATNKAVTWESDDTEVATVDENGEVTAKKVGSATITCKSVADNTKSASCEVTVIPAPTRITITQDSIDGFTNTYDWYTWTSDSVSGKVYAYKNSGIQMNSSKDGYAVYNTTAIPGKITKITMTKASGTTRTWNAYVSTSAMTEAAAEGSTALTSKEVASTTNWDVTGTNAYFYLEVTGGSTVIGSIVIEYEDVTPPTSLEDVETSVKAVKLLRNGILLIEKNGHVYNAIGQMVK